MGQDRSEVPNIRKPPTLAVDEPAADIREYHEPLR